jgi:PTHB1 C-terminus
LWEECTKRYLLHSFCVAQMIDNGEIGWEECTEAAMTNLLRTVLAKNAKEAAAPLPALVVGKDTGKLKKHMSLVLERMAHGMKLTKSEKSDKGAKEAKAAAKAEAAAAGQ